MNPSNEFETQVQQFRKEYEQVYQEISKVIVGHAEIVHGVLTCLFVGGHALLEGVPGLGKTLLVRTLSQVLDLQFNRIQFTPDLMPADIIGTNIIMEDAGRQARLQLSAGPDLRPDRPGRRDQPRHAQDAVGHARSDAGAFGHRRRHDPQAQGAVLRDGDAEPDRAGRDLSAARSPARPLLVQAGRQLLDARGADGHPRPHDHGASGRRPPRSWTASKSCKWQRLVRKMLRRPARAGLRHPPGPGHASAGPLRAAA